MIDFGPSIEEPKLLRRAVLWARRNKDHIPSLSQLAPKRDLQTLTDLARSWQAVGLGSLIEVSDEGRRTVLFSLNDTALATVDATYQRSIMGRLQSVPRSDWIAILALIVSAVAFFKQSK